MRKISLTSCSPSTSKTTRRRRSVPSTLASAYAVMEITAEAVANAPKIEHLFRSIGGRMAALRYLESSDEPEAQAVIKLYRRMPKSWARHVPLEAYAVAVKISPMRLFGLIAQEMIDDSERVVQLLANVRHPEVVQATIQAALKPSGVKDRKMLYKATGFLPVPKNSISMLNNQPHIDARSVANTAVLPPMEMVSRQLMECFKEIASQPGQPVPEMTADEGTQGANREFSTDGVLGSDGILSVPLSCPAPAHLRDCDY